MPSQPQTGANSCVQISASAVQIPKVAVESQEPVATLQKLPAGQVEPSGQHNVKPGQPLTKNKLTPSNARVVIEYDFLSFIS